MGAVNPRVISISALYAILILLSLFHRSLAELVFLILITCILSQSLNIIMGLAGLVSLGQAFFFGTGVYMFTYLVINEVNPYLSIIFGGLISAVFALALGLVLLRLRGVYFACGTLVITLAAPYFISGTGIVGGFAGLNIYKYISPFYNIYICLFSLLATSVIMSILTIKLLRSPFGYSLKAIKDDHDAAETLGINTFRQKTIAFCISALFSGVAGAIWAFKQAYILPSIAFNPLRSIEAILTMLVGGAGTVTGPILGTIIYEAFRDAVMRIAPGLQVLIFGILVIIIVLMAPEGLIGLLRKRFKSIRDKIF